MAGSGSTALPPSSLPEGRSTSHIFTRWVHVPSCSVTVDDVTVPGKGGRPRKWRSDADRVRAFRARQRGEVEPPALTVALDDGDELAAAWEQVRNLGQQLSAQRTLERSARREAAEARRRLDAEIGGSCGWRPRTMISDRATPTWNGKKPPCATSSPRSPRRTEPFISNWRSRHRRSRPPSRLLWRGQQTEPNGGGRRRRLGASDESQWRNRPWVPSGPANDTPRSMDVDHSPNHTPFHTQPDEVSQACRDSESQPHDELAALHPRLPAPANEAARVHHHSPCASHASHGQKFALAALGASVGEHGQHEHLRAV